MLHRMSRSQSVPSLHVYIYSFCVSLLGLTGVTYGQTQPDSPYPVSGLNAQHTGQSAFTGPLSASVGILWNFYAEVAANDLSSVAVDADGTVYIGAANFVYAVDGFAGDLIWSASVGGVVQTTPAIGAAGFLYVGCNNGYAYGLSTATGYIEWEYAANSLLTSSPVIGPTDIVYFGDEDGTVHALDGASGVQIWSAFVGVYPGSPTLGMNGEIYIPSAGANMVYALNALTGEVLWSQTTANAPFAITVGANGTVFLAGSGTGVQTLSPTTGNVSQSYPGATVYASPAISTDGVLFYGDSEGIFWAVTTKASVLWTYQLAQTGAAFQSAATIGADGTVYVGATDHNVYALNGSTGALIWQFTTGNVVLSQPVIGATSTLYVKSSDANTYALVYQGPSPTATATPSYSPTPSATPSVGWSASVTASYTPSETALPTASYTPTPSYTPTASYTPSPSGTESYSPTGSATATESWMWSASETGSSTASPSATASETPSQTWDYMWSAAPSSTPDPAPLPGWAIIAISVGGSTVASTAVVIIALCIWRHVPCCRNCGVAEAREVPNQYVRYAPSAPAMYIPSTGMMVDMGNTQALLGMPHHPLGPDPEESLNPGPYNMLSLNTRG
jgi:outer membrane protein assembly factor BamB